MDRIWILGPSDPIERLLRECGESVLYYTGEPIHVGEASTVYTVDCEPLLAVGPGWDDPGDYYQPIRLGDRWYPRAAVDYTRRIVSLSSIKQVVAELARLSPCPLPWDGDYVPGLAHGQYFLADDGRYLVGTEDGALCVPRDIIAACGARVRPEAPLEAMETSVS